MYPTIVPQVPGAIVGQAIHEARRTASEVHAKPAVTTRPRPAHRAAGHKTAGRLRRGAARTLFALGRRVAGGSRPQAARPAHSPCDDAVRAA